MTTAIPTAVTYSGLPVSSGGAHSLARMSRRVAYARTIDFLETCTEPLGPIDYFFHAYDVPELGRNGRLERELQRRFGRFGPLGRVSVAEVDVAGALDFLDEIDPQPANQWEMVPIWFWATASFRILDPASGRPLPGQDPALYGGFEYDWQRPLGTSGLRLILQDVAKLGMELSIPDAGAELLERVVPWLQMHLPFRLSPKHWRAWTPTRKGSYKARKVAPPPSDIRRR
jgi:hypothetical protein